MRYFSINFLIVAAALGRSVAILTWLTLPIFASDAPAATNTVPQLNTKTSWFGNTWGGGEGPLAPFVQQNIDDIAVAGDRIYAITGWDEHGSEAGIYSTDGAKVTIPEVDGDWNAQFHSWAFSGGTAVAVSSDYIFYATGQGGQANNEQNYIGVSRFTRATAKAAGWPGAVNNHRLAVALGKVALGKDATDKRAAGKNLIGITGLAVQGNQLFIADPNTNRILIHDAASMAKIGEFLCPNPGRIAVDAGAENDLWIIDTQAHLIRRWSRAGKPTEAIIKDCQKPVALCIDVRSGDLLVADGALQRQQIRRYKSTTAAYVPGADFGSAIYLGAQPGVVTPGRFFSLTGIATDAAGNLYVSESAYGAKLYKFDAKRKLVWERKGLEFVSCADADPTTDTSIYSDVSRYVLDYAQEPGKSWTEAAVTLDPLKYPDDPRLSGNGMSMHMLVLGGRKLMFGKKQMSGSVYVYRFDGEIAVPAAIISNEWRAIDGPPAENFSVRWTGFLTAPSSGHYLLTTEGDDGVRLFLDGKQVIDGWRTRGKTIDIAEVDLVAGTRVPITIEYFQGGGPCSMVLGWSPPGQPWRVISPSALSCDIDGKKPGLQAEYFSDTELHNRAMQRVDADICFPLFTGEVSSATFSRTEPGFPPNGPYLWSDSNGDGQMQAKEIVNCIGFGAPSIDSVGNLIVSTDGWDAGKGSITIIPFTGVDARGVPQWNVNACHSTIIPKVGGLRHLSKMYHDPVQDRMYLGVWTEARPYPGGGWEQMNGGSELMRFDTWSKTPTLVWQRSYELPVDSTSKTPPSWSFESDHAFIAYTWKHAMVAVDVLQLSDGARLGRLLPTGEIGSTTGWFDMQDSIQTHRRKDGTYLIFAEECWMAKGIYWMWKP